MSNPQDMAGKEINGYKVIKPIGQGKFSIVFKAEKIVDGQIVALKQIKVIKFSKMAELLLDF